MSKSICFAFILALACPPLAAAKGHGVEVGVLDDPPPAPPDAFTDAPGAEFPLPGLQLETPPPPFPWPGVTGALSAGFAQPGGQLGGFGARPGFVVQGQVGMPFGQVHVNIGAMYIQMPAAGGNQVVNFGIMAPMHFPIAHMPRMHAVAYGSVGLGLVASRCGPPGVIPGNYGPAGMIGVGMAFPNDFFIELTAHKFQPIQGSNNEALSLVVGHRWNMAPAFAPR